MAEGVARQGFDLDLRYGKEREQAFLAALGDCHFEGKSDQKAKETGRVFIETHQCDRFTGEWRESGINVSTAGWWFIEVIEECWVLRRRVVLKELAMQVEERRGGDENRFRGRAVPIQWLLQPFRIVRKP
jgi:hypothetical protein